MTKMHRQKIKSKPPETIKHGQLKSDRNKTTVIQKCVRGGYLNSKEDKAMQSKDHPNKHELSRPHHIEYIQQQVKQQQNHPKHNHQEVRQNQMEHHLIQHSKQEVNGTSHFQASRMQLYQYQQQKASSLSPSSSQNKFNLDVKAVRSHSRPEQHSEPSSHRLPASSPNM